MVDAQPADQMINKVAPRHDLLKSADDAF